MPKPAHNAPVHRLALRVHEIAQLFNSMDPTPFLNKDLDPAANTFIENWASVYPSHSNFHITIHLEQWPEDGDPTGLLTEAVHNHFSYKAIQTRKSLKNLLLQGRISFAIGIVFVTLCLLGANAIGRLGDFEGYTIARESLTIVGWVAMWRPMQIFLYDWWPLQKQIHLYLNLSHAHIQVVQGK
jgi:hypothetical protein